MSDFWFELPDSDPATISALTVSLGLEVDGEPGRLKPGVAIHVIENMVAVPAVLDKDGNVLTPAKMHKAKHLNLRLGGEAAQADRRPPIGNETEDGSHMRDLMSANDDVREYKQPARVTIVRNAPSRAKMIHEIDQPQVVWA